MKPVFLPKLPQNCCLIGAPLNSIDRDNQVKKMKKSTQIEIGKFFLKSRFLEIRINARQKAKDVITNIFGNEIGS